MTHNGKVWTLAGPGRAPASETYISLSEGESKEFLHVRIRIEAPNYVIT